MHYAYGFFYFLYQLEPKSCFHKDGWIPRNNSKMSPFCCKHTLNASFKKAKYKAFALTGSFAFTTTHPPLK